MTSTTGNSRRSASYLATVRAAGRGNATSFGTFASASRKAPAIPLGRLDLDAGETLFCGSGEDNMRTAAQIIASAVNRGALHPDRADHYLQRAQAGDDITWLDAAQAVYAHADRRTRRNVHRAIDDALDESDRTDEFGRLFPDHAPLGPPTSEGDQTHYSPKKRTRVEIQKRRHASAREPLTDDEQTFQALYGYLPPAGYFED
jgi:hypothetical protein